MSNLDAAKERLARADAMAKATVTREQLERLWQDATTLNDAASSPLTQSIITEALECGEGDAQQAVNGLWTLVNDIQELIVAINTQVIKEGLTVEDAS